MKRDPLETIRAKLNRAQWLALNYLVKCGRESGHPYGWIETCRECTASVSTGLQRHGLAIHERKYQWRGPNAGKVVKRTKLKERGTRLAEMGPPPGLDLPPGQYVWR